MAEVKIDLLDFFLKKDQEEQEAKEAKEKEELQRGMTQIVQNSRKDERRRRRTIIEKSGANILKLKRLIEESEVEETSSIETSISSNE